MNKYAQSILLILFLIVMGTINLSATPRLSIAEKSFDFGFSPQNAKLSHIFWLKAEGADSLKILNVIPGCGCTKAPLESNLLEGGDSTRLEIIFSTGKRRGKQSKSPRIQTNAGGREQRVTIAAHVVTRPDSTYPIIISPYKLTLAQFADKKQKELSFTIDNISIDEIPIRLIAHSSDLFTITLPDVVGPKSTAECSLVLKEAGLASSFEKSFTIELGDANKTRFTIPVKHHAKPKSKQVTTVDQQ